MGQEDYGVLVCVVVVVVVVAVVVVVVVVVAVAVFAAAGVAYDGLTLRVTPMSTQPNEHAAVH